jgi:hypothetical protein
VPTAIPDQPIGDLNCLVAPQRRADVVEAAEIRERQIWSTPIERIARNTCDPKRAFDVLLERVEIRGSGAVPVVVHTQLIHQASDRTHVAEGSVNALCIVRTANGWKRIVQYAVPRTNLQTKIDVASATAAPSATATASAKSTETTTPSASPLALLL